ncbi:MAG TPA: pilin [Candidatus Sulfotelmatobacter sp.]|nr:pilin [Candidatus Sulfotelmatobacter sp.]
MKKLFVVFIVLFSLFFLRTPTKICAAPLCAAVGEHCGASGSGGKGFGPVYTACCNPSKNGKPTSCGKDLKCVEDQPKNNCITTVGAKCNNGLGQSNQCCTINSQGQSLFCSGNLTGTCQIKINCAGHVGDSCAGNIQCCNVETGTSNPLICGSDNKCQTHVVTNVSPTPLPPPPSPPCDQWNNGQCNSFLSAFGKLPTNPTGFIKVLFDILLSASGGIALLLIIKAGYQLMTSQGKPEQMQAGRDQLVAAIVGLVFLIFSFVILQLIGFDILHLPGFGQ